MAVLTHPALPHHAPRDPCPLPRTSSAWPRSTPRAAPDRLLAYEGTKPGSGQNPPPAGDGEFT
jgi:hypothetical protein